MDESLDRPPLGTWRSLVRAVLGLLELATGRLRQFRLRHPEAVQRLVFVCMGNICRSTYGHHVALEYGMNVASLGLSTSNGGSSPAQAIAAAARANVDMQTHRSAD